MISDFLKSLDLLVACVSWLLRLLMNIH